ncbi:MAG TPA: hypothetical protein VKX40_02060 [Aequorivita sp.]|nr:hypothetical protein [Aequorivita sp.]
MKDTAYITSKNKGYDSYVATKKPIVVILTVAIVIVIALNLINSIIIN